MTATEAIAAELVTLGPTTNPTLLARAFLAGYKPATARVYELGLRQWFAFAEYNGFDPIDCRRTHLDLWRCDLESGGRQPATIANRLGAIAMFMRWCFEEELIGRNPAAHLKRPQVPTESSTVGLSRDEASRLLYVAEAARPCEYVLVALMMLCGLRVSEALSIDIETVTMQRGHRVVPIVGKGDKPALVPMAPRVCRALDMACGERTAGPLILDTHGNRMNRGSAGWVLDKLGRRAGLGHCHPHMLRHIFITAALDSGVPLRDVQNSARHADPRTTSKYDRARHNLDRHCTYNVASYLAGG
jgi:integrase/recombinase XerD